MHNDSIDTLLLRHYGRSAPAPVDLEAHLLASVRYEAAEMGEHQQIARETRRITRTTQGQSQGIASTCKFLS